MWTIAIADDYPVVRNVLGEFFSCFPDLFRVVGEASNGEEAVRLVQEKNPDFLLMDITMPLMDGLVATKILKQQLGYRGLVVTYTGYPKPGLGEMAKKAGAREHFVKPLNLMALKKKIVEEYSLELKDNLKRAI